MSISISGVGVGYSGYNSPFTRRVKDNPSGAAIAQKHLSQINGYNQGTRSAENGRNLANTADGALSSIHDSLQRMRELSVQASSSAIYSDSDRAGMQKEVDQLKKHIEYVAKNTQFNQINLLDGSMADLHLALNPSGGGMEIQTSNATLEALGIADYDLTGNFDIKKLDDAISKVSDARGSYGSVSNALEYSSSVSSISAFNATASKSNIEDMDIGQYISDKKKEDIMRQYQYFTLNSQTAMQKNMVSMLLG